MEWTLHESHENWYPMKIKPSTVIKIVCKQKIDWPARSCSSLDSVLMLEFLRNRYSLSRPDMTIKIVCKQKIDWPARSCSSLDSVLMLEFLRNLYSLSRRDVLSGSFSSDNCITGWAKWRQLHSKKSVDTSSFFTPLVLPSMSSGGFKMWKIWWFNEAI